ncbi:MAG: hypothetical protein ABJA67_01560 [Chthonomonadales bacterium]
MGKQIAIAMTHEDELLFLEFLLSTAPIQLFGSFAPTPAELDWNELPPIGTGTYDCTIWNGDFPWSPEYGAVGPDSYDPTCIGWVYHAPICLGPHLEWDRSNLERGMFGRLYWGRRTGVEYDHDAFDQWIAVVWRWIRKNGKKFEKGEAYTPYCLPGAFAYLTEHPAEQGA